MKRATRKYESVEVGDCFLQVDPDGSDYARVYNGFGRNSKGELVAELIGVVFNISKGCQTIKGTHDVIDVYTVLPPDSEVSLIGRDAAKDGDVAYLISPEDIEVGDVFENIWSGVEWFVEVNRIHDGHALISWITNTGEFCYDVVELVYLTRATTWQYVPPEG